MKIFSLLFLSFFFVFLCACATVEQKQSAPPISRNPQSTDTLSDSNLQKQVDLSFADKFLVVTNDIKSLSKSNILSLEKAMLSTYPSTTRASETEVDKFDESLAITHSTSEKSAVKILQSGAILSVDELVRRNIVPLNKKHVSPSSPEYDDQIGEQDVVFFAIRDRNHLEQSRFGNVTFVFDKYKTLNEGYFTPYPFVAGSPEFFMSDDGVLDPVPSAIVLYKNFIFTGVKAYRQFIRLSLTQEKINQTLIFPKFHSRISDLREGSNKDSDRANSIVRSLLQSLHQQDPKVIRYSLFDIKNVINFLTTGAADRPNEFGPLYSVLNAYKGFPITIDKKSPLLTSPWEFWELKIPTQVDLSLVKKIVFPLKTLTEIPNARTHLGSWSEKNIDSTLIIKAAKDYANKSGRTLTIKKLTKSYELSFSDL